MRYLYLIHHFHQQLLACLKEQHILLWSSLLLCISLTGCKEKPLPPTETEIIANALSTGENLPYPEAQALFNNTLENYPENPDLIEALALLENQAGHFETAADLFSKLAQLATDDEALYLRYAAEAYAKANNYTQSALFYTYYLVHEPQDASAWLTLSKIYEKLNQLNKSLDAYYQAFKINHTQNLIPDYIQLALKAKEYILADELLKQWEPLLTDDNEPIFQANAFDLYVAINDHQKAFEKLYWLKTHAISFLENPNRQVAVEYIDTWHLAQLEQIAREKQLEIDTAAEKIRLETLEAEKTAEMESLKAKIPSAQTYIEQASEAYKDQAYDKAQSLYWKALCLDMSSANIWKALSQAALHNQDFEMAQTAALEAQRRHPDDILYTLNLLDVLQKTATKEDLLDALIKAKDHFPKSISLTYDLAYGYETLTKNYRNARILYEEYLTMANKNHPHYQDAINALKRLP